MALERVDYLAKALDVLAQQYRGKPNFEALLAIIARQFQDLEAAAQQLLVGRVLDNAQGEQLSVLERVVGQRQFVFSDPEVRRAWIRARILLNRSSGTADELISVFQAVLAAPLVPELSEMFPAALELRVAGGELAANMVEPLARMLQLGKAAGVGAQLVWTPQPDAQTLFFASPVAFLSDSLGGGELNFGVTGVAGTFPADGTGVGISVGYDFNQETFPGYDGFDGSSFSVDGVGSIANPHDPGEEVLLDPYPGAVMGDANGIYANNGVVVIGRFAGATEDGAAANPGPEELGWLATMDSTNALPPAGEPADAAVSYVVRRPL